MVSRYDWVFTCISCLTNEIEYDYWSLTWLYFSTLSEEEEKWEEAEYESV